MVIRSAQNGGADVELELRGPDMFSVGGLDGAHRAKTSLDEATYAALLEELAQAFRKRADHGPALVQPAIWVDAPDGAKLCLSRRDLPPSVSPEGCGSADEALPCWETAVYGALRSAMFAAVQKGERFGGWKKRPVNVPELADLHHWMPSAGSAGRTVQTAPPAGSGYYLTQELLEGRSFLAKQPGAVLDIYLCSSHGEIALQELAAVWNKSDDPFRLAIVARLISRGDEPARRAAARLLADRIVAARSNPNTDQAYLNSYCWKLLFGLECAAARGDRWPRDVAVSLLERDTDTDDQARILFQWLPTLLLNYGGADRAGVGRLLMKRLNCKMVYNPMLAAEPLAELAPAGAAEALRRASASLKAEDRILGLTLDAALVRLGDRDAVARFVTEMETKGLKADGREPFLSALRFLPSEKDLKAGLKDAPVGDRRALADYLVTRAESGAFLKATPYSRLASPRFASWLLTCLDQGRGPRSYLLDQLAWQTEPEAVDRMIALLTGGDQEALAAVSNRWSPRFFPLAELNGHAKYYLKPEWLRGVDWREVRRAARAGTLHYYSVGNFPDEYWPVKDYLGEER